MGDKRINDPATQETDEARRTLSEHALDPRSSSDRLQRVSDTNDRASFRDWCANARAELKGSRSEASNMLSAINEAVEGKDGKPPTMQAGSKEHQEALVKAGQAYEAAVGKADKLLYATNPDGTIKIDPTSNRPVESDFLKRVNQERQLIAQEMQFLKQVRDSGRALTPEEMQKLGVKSNDAKVVLEAFTQQDMMLDDVQRAAGYARANYGLAMIRASAKLDDASKEGLIAQGRAKLAEAALCDPKMEGPPPDRNYEKNLKAVVKAATGQEISLEGGQQPGGPQPGGDANQRIVQDGQRRLPTGDSRTDAQGFVNPFAMAQEVRQKQSSPMGEADIKGWAAAINAADNIDRAALMQKMQADKAYIDQRLASPEGERIKATLLALQTEQQKLNTLDLELAKLTPGIVNTAAGNPQATEQIRGTLRNLSNPAAFNEFVNNPANKASLQAFQQLPGGADYVSKMSQFHSANQAIAQYDRVIEQTDPRFAQARRDLERNSELYNSSEAVRIQFVKALVSDAKNQEVPGYAQLAQAQMQRVSEINPNLSKDPEFATMAQMLGMRPDANGRLEVVQGANPGGQSTLTDANVQSISKAYQAYATAVENARAGKPFDPALNQVFQQAITDAGKINPQEVAQRRQQAQQELTTLGWNQQLEQQYVGLNQAVGQAFSKIPADKQTAIQQVQTQIGRINSTDPTAQQQRQALEGQLQQMGGTDANVKAWLDARVQLATMYQTNPQLMQARMNFEATEANLVALEHAKPIAEGLYGAALVAGGDKNAARPYLVNAARDQAALQIAPEIAQAIQQHGDPAIMTEAAQRASDQGPQLEQPAVAQNEQLYQQAGASLAQAGQIVDSIQPGTKLTDQQKAALQQAIDINKTVDPNALEQLKGPLQQRLLTGWTEQHEQQWKAVNLGVMQAQQKISPASAQTLMTLQQSLNPQDPNSATQMQAKLTELAATDPTVKAYMDATNAYAQFYQTNGQLAANRDQYETATAQIAQLQHGKAIAETMYAAALLKSGDQAALPQAKQLMQSAMGDQALGQVFPQAQEVARALGLSGAAANMPSELDAKIPGYKQLREAEAIMQDKSLTPQQRIEKAAPLYAQSVEESKKINHTKLDQDLATIGTRLNEIKTLLPTVQDNPTKVAELQKEGEELSVAADGLANLRLQPMKSRLMEAIAYNSAANELYEQAKANGADKDTLTRTADGYNAHAAQVLQGLEKADPRMWRENPAIQGAIVQAQQHKLIDTSSGNAIGQVLNTRAIANIGIFGPGQGRMQPITISENAGALGNTIGTVAQVGTRGIQPLWMSMNIAGDVMQTAGQVPVVGFIPGALGAGLSRTEETRPGAAMALARAKAKDETAANGAVGDIKHQLLNQGVYIAGDIGSAYAGMYAGNVAANLAAKRFGPLGQAVVFGTAGLTTAYATNNVVDYGAHKLLGTDQRDQAELLTRSAASFGMTWGLKGLSNYRASNSAAFLNAEGQGLSFGQSMQVWNKGLTTIPSVGTQNIVLAEGAAPTAVSNRFATTFGALAEAERATVSTALNTNAKFATMNAGAQYNALTKVMGQNGLAAAESNFMTRSMASNWSKEAMAWRFGTGGGAMALYGAGEINPLVTNKATGEKYTWGDMARHSTSSFAYGGTASFAAPVVGKAMDFLVKKPLEYTIAKPAAWIFGKGGAQAGSGLSELTHGTWQGANSKFWAYTGENAISASLKRTAVGYGGGFGVGALTHSPLVNDKYTWGDAMGYGNKYGLYAGGAMLASPLALHGGHFLKEGAKWGYNHTVVPGFNRGILPAFTAPAEGAVEQSIMRTALHRGAIGYGGGGLLGLAQHNPLLTNPETGQKYTWGESLSETNKWGIGGAVVLGTTPWTQRLVNAARPGVERFVQGSTVQGASQRIGAAGSEYIGVYAAPTSLLVSDGASNFYGIREWNKIDAEANAILAAYRAEEAKKAQTQPAGGR